MVNQARATLESALRARQLDRTLTTALPPLDRTDSAARLPTGVAALDACLGGGIPRGEVSDLAGPPSSGRTTLLHQVVAAATHRGEIVALVDTCDRLDVASMAAAGADLDRVLWVRSGRGDGRPGAPLLDGDLERAVKACTLVLQAGGFGMVALDLADVPRVALGRLPFTTWLRLGRMVEGSDTVCLLVLSEPMGRSAGGVTLRLHGRAAWSGDADRSRRLAGLDLCVRVVAPRGRGESEVACTASTGEWQ